MTRGRPPWPDWFRELDRLPFVVGVLFVTTAALGIIGLVLTTITGVRPFRGTVLGSPWFVGVQTMVMGVFGIVVIRLYYKYRA
jgi:hypothetical protein